MGRIPKYNHDAILADWLARMACKEIAAKYGCAGNFGAELATKRGVKRSPAVAKMAQQRASELRRQAVAKSAATAKLKIKHKKIAAYVERHGTAVAAAKYGYSLGGVAAIAKRHGWTPAPPRFDQAAILKDYLAGMKLRQIAEKHGCEMSYASQLAKRAGKNRKSELKKRNSRA